MTLAELEKQWEDVSHGPCFPLHCTDRFGTNRIEDCHGNVVIDAPLNPKQTIWLSEAAEYLVAAGNMAPALLKEIRAARAWYDARKTVADWPECQMDQAGFEAYRAAMKENGG